MNNLTIIMVLITLLWNIPISAQNGGIVFQVMRPAYIDTSAAEAQGAVLVSVSDYPSDLVKYRLYNGSSQHYCWNEASKSFITSTSYTSAPLAPGTPSSLSTFWIIFQRGSNNSSSVSYRDRIDPFTSNYNTIPLSEPITIKIPYELTGRITGIPEDDLQNKYVILAYNGTELINASSTDLETGSFKISIPQHIETDKIEVRSIGDIKISEITGNWTNSGSVGDIVLSSNTGKEKPGQNKLCIYPIPADKEIFIKGLNKADEIEIIDISGKGLKKIRVDSDETIISVHDLMPGIYFLKTGELSGIFIKR